MSTTIVHIVAGLAAIVAGAVALSAAKGEALHRKAGSVFVAAMVVMAALGAAIAATRLHQPFQTGNVMAGTFTIYLVTTALLTVRDDIRKRWMDLTALAVVIAVAAFGFGMAAFALAGGNRHPLMFVPPIVFGTIALLAAIGDVRMLRAGGLKGKPRLVRHLWRMCTAMFIATGSFFAGQAKVFPEEYRSAWLMFGPMLAVLATMIYWWIRVSRTRRPARTRIHAVPASHQSS